MNIRLIVIHFIIAVLVITSMGVRADNNEFFVTVPRHQLEQLIDDVCGNFVDRREIREGITFTDERWEEDYEICANGIRRDMNVQ